MIQNKIYRNNDIVNGKNDLEFLFTIPNVPVFQGCTKQDISLDLKSDMSFYISQSSGMVQINPLLPLDLIYQASHTPGTVGSLWRKHHESFAEFINEYKPQNVYELGGSHGILSEIYLSNNESAEWTIIDPTTVSVKNTKVKVMQEFFTRDTIVPNNIDMLVHSHVLEHVYDPRAFVESLTSLPKNIKMCFSVPHLKSFIEKKYTNAMNFEHTYFCTENYIEYLLETFGYTILKKEYHSDHSIFYATERTGEFKNVFYENTYSANKKLFDEFYSYQTTLVTNLNSQMNNNKVYLFGAHVFSQFLLSLGLNENNIKCILDNDVTKQNKRLYGTKFMVQSPSVLAGEESPHVIVKAGVYDSEIKKGLLEINPSIIFID